MKQVDKYIQLYKENKITPLQVKNKLKARKYNEFWGKLYRFNFNKHGLAGF